MKNPAKATYHLVDRELKMLQDLRERRRQTRADLPGGDVTFGARVADKVAAMMGSWPFIIIQSAILLVWIALNLTAWIKHWDPYPFILLNLALSFQAAYAAPFIMMSQNRQADIDRGEAKHDYEVNIKAELEIELLHEKIDKLREKEIQDLLDVIHGLQEQLTLLVARGA